MRKPLKAFISYSSKDQKAKGKLVECLTGMERERLIEIWADNEIIDGDKWREEIFDTNLPDSDLLLYLVSASSLDSENCNKELGIALEENIRPILIILEACDWENYKISNVQTVSTEDFRLNEWESLKLSDIQALPAGVKPLNEWNPRSKGWKSVVDGLRKDIQTILSRAELALQQGNFLMTLRQIDEAIKSYSRAIELNRYYAEAYNNRGVAYNQNGEYDFAIADFTKMVELKPNDPLAHRNRGAAHANHGDYGLALSDFDKAIDLNPDDSKVYNMRGNAYSAIRNFESAAADHIKAQELQPNDFAGYFGLGLADFGKKDFGSAVANYRQAILLNPASAEAYGNRGEAWLHLRDWEKARSDLMIAEEKGIDIIASFRNEYADVKDFERKNNVKLPEDIAEMLNPPAA